MTFNNALDEDVLNESPTSRWPRQFLDVGSGCGRVTLNVILPNVPDDVEKIVGVDICENMVSYARQNNSHPRIVYEKLDIRGDVSEFLELYGPFDRIYGFNSLNRVKEQSKAWNNMAKLLKPGGECLLFYSAWYSTPDVWRALALKERWSGFAEYEEEQAGSKDRGGKGPGLSDRPRFRSPRGNPPGSGALVDGDEKGRGGAPG
ncbi:hypothetical protein HPB52_015026 [Rhipicephalus sanguineus]|uniref:Methyltransferase domain-containing protein n=1 Tax=Rhipicephalus sanguineus TaxID=34632 RepID=A0A9D4PEI3_RHISA|nr:hypothetical protein HPB52_015026 [Rhipicephalus sanguineus]